MEQPPSGDGPTDQILRTEVACCIAGCGPAGAMLGLLLARAGVEVLVLEKHADFLRDFRGDTLHPSTLRLFDELGLAEQLLDLPHQKSAVLRVTTDYGDFTLADFRRLPGPYRFIAFMPQWDFLDFVVDQARRLPWFQLRMRAEALEALQEAGRVVGVTYRDQDGATHQVRARLTVAADGRGSDLRRSAGLRPTEFGAPIDVLWFRLPKRPTDRPQSFGRLAAGHLMVLIDRGDYWQIAYVIGKDAAGEIREQGLERFRTSVAQLVPLLADRVGELRTWDDVRTLRVQVDRLRRWFRPGLLCIGDAAHAMSPIGGVGINMAVHDAVATANLLARPLGDGTLSTWHLARVQLRRTLPTVLVQRGQRAIQDYFLSPLLAGRLPGQPPLVLRALRRYPILQAIPARLIGLGVLPEHVRSPTARGVQPSRSAPITRPTQPDGTLPPPGPA
jgi:2-polyprenyl-6-methoxyphenol hydroxylase-like FAD-dependent oxidoreductase